MLKKKKIIIQIQGNTTMHPFSLKVMTQMQAKWSHLDSN